MVEQILLQQHQDYIYLIQLTDTHILSEEGATFDSVDTTTTLQQVISHAQSMFWPPDAVLLTGDLVHDPEPMAYERLCGILDALQVKIFCIPGNHDDPVLMKEIMQRNNISMAKKLEFREWNILMLDTYLANTHSGYLKDSELEFLDSQLYQQENKHVLVCLHHPPVSTGSPWMDKMSLKNSRDLFAILDRYSSVKGLLWGHIHQEFDNNRNHVRLMASPSTCVQFTPGSDSYVKDNKLPGYRQLKLYDSGKIETEVIRVGSHQ